MLAQKIFITGIYGSGKTTLANLLARLSPKHKLLEFDELFDYTNAHLPSSLDPVYRKLLEHEFTIMDALPLIYISVHGERLENFIREEDSCIIIVRCSKATWLDTRLPLKKEVSQEVLKSAEAEYTHFYEETVPYLEDKYAKILLTYDSEKNTLL